MQMSNKRALIMAGVAFSAIMSGVTAMPALAQEAGPAADEEVQEVVVTGTRIRRPNLKSASPITSIDSAEVQLQGAIATDKFLATLPQIEAGANENLSNGSTGRATINLRSLGVNRGLVLIDGQRILPAQATDLNFVPSTLVQRTDVLTGGASSVYGSDAMSGVVNFILLKDLQGVKVDAQYSIYNHKNDDNYLRSIQSARGFELADEEVWDGRKTDFNIAAGANLDDGKGNITGYFGYRKMDGVTQANRDYSNCALTYPNSAARTYACGGSSTHGFGSFRPLTRPDGTTILPAQTYANAKDGSRTWVTPDSSFDYNYSPPNFIQRNSERYTGGAFLNYTFNDHAEAYGSFMYMDDHSKSQVAPSGIWTGRGFKVNCNNPLMSAQQRTILCGSASAASFTTAQQATTWVALRAVAGEPRRNDMRHTNFRTVFGLRGEIVDGWDYDVSYLYASARNRSNYQNDINQDKVERALNAIEVGGVLQCVNTAGGCKPIDVFSANGPSPEGFAYIYSPTFTANDQDMKVVTAFVSGDLGQYGATSPWASDGLAIVLGGEHREETLDIKLDEVQLNAGQVNSDGVIEVDELFTELEMPIVQDKPFIYSLAVSAGYRTSTIKVSSSKVDESEKEAETYKFEGRYQPTPDVLLRASYNQAMRNPNITELFAAQSVGNVAGIDPCAPATLQPGITFEQCARTGVTQAQWTNMSIPDCPARVCTGLGGGNPDLFAETGKTTTYGIVFTPRAIPTLAVSLDYFKIRIEDYIGSVSPTLSLSQCVSTGSPYFCGLINRDPLTGAIFGSNINGGYITNTNLNTGFLETKGFDLSASYNLPLSTFFEKDYGSISFSMIGTYLKSLETEAVPGLGSYDCKGLYGPVCGQPAPKWRHSLRTTWSTPWTDMAYLPASVSLNWRHIGEVKLASNTGKPFLTGTRSVIDQKIPAIGYIDVATTFNLPQNFVMRAGINNLMDVAPPSVMDGLLVENGNGNTYPGTYEALGRMLFVGVSAKF